MQDTRNEVSDAELKTVIADFLDQGHVDNIIAMFSHEPVYYTWTADLLKDTRMSVRLGLTVLFEELYKQQRGKMVLAVPSLRLLLNDDSPQLRGEAISLLGIINTPESRALIWSMENDPSPLVREMVQIVLDECDD